MAISAKTLTDSPIVVVPLALVAHRVSITTLRTPMLPTASTVVKAGVNEA